MAKVKTLKRRTAFENSKFNVFADHITDGQGLEVLDYVSIAPKVVIEGMVTGVSVLPIRGEDIGLLSMYRHAVGEMFWEAPRGFLDPGEPAAVSALREMEEETGHTCEAGKIINLGTLTQEASTLAARIALFAAESCTPILNPVPHDELGLEEFRWFSIDEVAAMAADSRIEDACTLITFYRYLAQVHR